MKVIIISAGTVERGARDDAGAPLYFGAGESVDLPDAVAFALVDNGHAVGADDGEDLVEGGDAPGERPAPKRGRRVN